MIRKGSRFVYTEKTLAWKGFAIAPAAKAFAVLLRGRLSSTLVGYDEIDLGQSWVSVGLVDIRTLTTALTTLPLVARDSAVCTRRNFPTRRLT